MSPILTKRFAGVNVEKNGRKALNLLMLVGGFGMGQGSMFLAQTWLLAEGSYDLLAFFGTHFSFAILAILLVDAGSLTILAREVAHASLIEDGKKIIWRCYSEITSIRLVLVLGVILVAVIWIALSSPDPQSIRYWIYAAPGVCIWAFNLSGILDGLKMSGVSGMTGSIAYIASAISLVVVSVFPQLDSGATMGAGLSVGYLSTVWAQLRSLRMRNTEVQFEMPSTAAVMKTARASVAMLGSTLPGQFYFRIQLVISSAYLGGTSTAILIYVNQIVSAISQLIGFVRRVEFPHLVAALARSKDERIRKVIGIQKIGSWVALASTIGVAVSGYFISQMSASSIQSTGEFMSFYSILVLSGAITLTLRQGLAAVGLYGCIMISTIASTIVGLLACLLLVQPLQLYGLLIGSLVSNALSTVLSVRFLNMK